LIGPFIFPGRLTGAVYLQFLQEELPQCCIPVMGQMADWQGERFPWEPVQGV
jgi:hypothetical protein